MSGPKFTPGPWRRLGTTVRIPSMPAQHDGGGFDLRDAPDAEANAALCAEAPNLFWCLHRLICSVQDNERPEWQELKDARAALQKAAP